MAAVANDRVWSGAVSAQIGIRMKALLHLRKIPAVQQATPLRTNS